MVDITGIDKAVLLHALVINGHPLGLGALQSRPFSVQEAQEWIDNNKAHDMGFSKPKLRFDYVCGVPIKSDLSGDTCNPDLYDRDQGEGAFLRVVESIKNKEK
jgi:hypothetical protein